MEYAVLFQEGVPRCHLPGLPVDGEGEPAADHIGDLGIGVAGEGALAPVSKVFSTHISSSV